MILEVTEEELNYLLDNKYLKPNGLSTCSDNYLIDVINYKGEKKEVSVVYRKSDTGSGLIHTDTSKSGQATLFPTNKQVSSTQNSNSDTDIKAVDVTLTDPDNWIDEWRIAWNNKRVRGMGDRAKCVSNMREFMLFYPQYTRDIIFKARDRYLQSFRGDYAYLEQADYFIKKNIVEEGERIVRRTLLQYCEEVYLTEIVKLKVSTLDTNISSYDDI